MSSSKSDNLDLPTGKDIVYKIRRQSDGLFSVGGSTPSFSKTGKIWRQRGHLTSHLNQLWNGHGSYSLRGTANHVYEDCEIIAYIITETQVGTAQTIVDYTEERKREQAEKDQAAALRRERQQKDNRRKQYEELKKEFAND